jgi:hypothetical protein
MRTNYDPRLRKAYDTALYQLEGKHVAGRYMGFQYAGVVTSTRQNTASYRPELTVTLDAPIVVFGESKTAVILDAYCLERESLQCSIEQA